jgi:Anti-sigma factor NepR
MTERKPPEKPQLMDTTSIKNAANRQGKDASLGRDVQVKIGQQLRAYYDGLIEPTPNRFVDLLQKLEKSSGGKGSAE